MPLKGWIALITAIAAAAIATEAAAKEKDLTAPILTCGIIGQLVQDAAISLGPVYQSQQPPAVLQVPAHGNTINLPAKPHPGAGVNAHSKPTTKQQAVNNKIVDPQAYHFTGEQMWGRADVTLVTAARGFDVKVKCTLPVSMWALYADDSQIASSSVSNLTSFSFKGNELYTPPYKLVLNVIYMGIPNQIRVEIK